MLYHFSKILHPNHYILIDIMHNLVHMYAAKKALSRPEKERKIQLCVIVLETLSKVDPGYTKWRGTLLQVKQTSYLSTRCIAISTNSGTDSHRDADIKRGPYQ